MESRMTKEQLDQIERAASAACLDPDVWTSVELPGFGAADREFVATCHPSLVLLLVAMIRELQERGAGL